MLAENGATTGIGGYGEVRPFYTTDAYVVTGNSGPEWRTVHLGLDIWDRAGTPVYAPLDGWVHSFADNAGERNYGPTIILAHQPENGPLFYTLYGHLDSASLEGLQEGAPIARGQVIARIGDRPYNGNWPPHLHFQVMLDILGYKGDYPGWRFPGNPKYGSASAPIPVNWPDCPIAKKQKPASKNSSSDGKRTWGVA
ncbi:MAG: peptidoglycan DD-metalloendopeptidase family protein [Saprospiraceae bacterium]|nr:peptidoglycan DD-metalloendopeptidase family protein [Saprospiraceae bacterium]